MSCNIWNEEETKKLIKLRGIEYSHIFSQNTSSKKKMEGWNTIKEKLGVDFTTKQIARKWRLLLNRYKDIQTPTNKSEECKKNFASSWPYYDLMNSIIEHQFTASSSYLSDSTISPPLNDENFIDDLSSNKYFKQESQLVHDLNVDEEMKKLCGEIFATKNFLLTFKCYFCSKILTNISEFSNHLQKSHSNLICNKRNDSNLSIIESCNIEKMSEQDTDAIDNNLNFETILIENIKKDSDAVFSTEPEYTEIITNCDIKSEHTSSATLLTDNHISIKEENTNEIDINNEDNLYEKSKKIIGTLLEETKKDVLECHFCNSAHPNKKSLNDHLRRHLNRGRFKCEFCSKGFSSNSDKKRHEKNIHFKNIDQDCNKNGSCDLKETSLCKIEAIRKTKDIPDDSNQQSTNIFQCEICNSVYSKQKYLNNHLKRHSSRGLYNCDFCVKSFSSTNDKRRHEKRLHLNEIIKNPNGYYQNKFMCEYCKSFFNAKNECEEHMKSCIGTEKLSCHICKKILSTKFSLVTHLKSHTDTIIRPHQCHLCERSFRDIGNLRVHVRRHLGQKILKCDSCDKRFITTTEKKIHERIHREERPYLCTECGKSFISSGSLSRHVKQHTGEKPHKCVHCDMSFASSSCLKRHSTKHSGLRPYVCNVCNATFPRGSGLRAHKNLHLEVGRYICQICDKKFKQHAGLYSHMKSHNVAKDK